jgi:hypothetical protein
MNETTSAAITTGPHHSHNEAVAQQLVLALALNPIVGDRQCAVRLMTRFYEDAAAIAGGAYLAAQILSDHKGAPGRTRMKWYQQFREAVVYNCELNGIAPTVSTDRVSGKRKGRFLDIAMNLQRVIPPEMRTKNKETVITRLKKSGLQGSG